MGRLTVRRQVRRLSLDHPPVTAMDTLAVEEPLEIRVGGLSLAVTMRTPGHDFELAAGFLLSEGILTRYADLDSVSYCAGVSPNSYNIVSAVLSAGVAAPDPSLARAFFTTSSCGLCGKASIDAVRTRSQHSCAADQVSLDPQLLVGLPDRLREQQAVFDKTGGLHAAAIFDVANDELLVLREDIGRHNAVDKVIGWSLMEDRIPAAGTVLMVSGRASFELVQKASMAGIPVLAAVSAPSSLAVDLAHESGMTLLGFVRGRSMVVYAGGERLTVERP